MKYLKYIVPLLIGISLILTIIDKVKSYLRSTNKPVDKVEDTSQLPQSADYYVQIAKSLNFAIAGGGTDVDSIEDIFNKIQPNELKRVHNIYIDLYNILLSSDLRDDLDKWYIFGNTELIKLIKSKYVDAGLHY